MIKKWLKAPKDQCNVDPAVQNNPIHTVDYYGLQRAQGLAKDKTDLSWGSLHDSERGGSPKTMTSAHRQSKSTKRHQSKANTRV